MSDTVTITSDVISGSTTIGSTSTGVTIETNVVESTTVIGDVTTGGTGAAGADGTNGTDGTDGADGLSAYEVAVAGGYGDTEVNWLLSLVGEAGSNGTNGLDGSNGTNGIDGTNGTDGVGITSVVKTSTLGLVDTYTITYTDSSTSTFDVTNGADGADSTVPGPQGEDGPNNITTSTTTDLTGFLKGNGSVVSADNSTYLTEETDPVFSASEAASFAAGDASKLSGIEAGADVTDATNVAAAGAVMSETDPVFTASDAASITSTDITNLGNLSGTNTGNQVGDGTTITGAGTVADPFVAVATDISGLIPYTGANSAVDLGLNDLTSAGYVHVNGVLANVATDVGIDVTIQGSGAEIDDNDGGGVTLATNIGLGTGREGYVNFMNATGYKSKFDTSAHVTADRTLIVPDADGTLALTSDIPAAYTDELAQDAVGGMVDTTLTYTDGTPELKVTNPVTPAATGFTISAGTTPKTLTVDDTSAINQDLKTTASPTFAGLTVDTNTLVVDSTLNRVGIGTASPSESLHIVTGDYTTMRFDAASDSGMFYADGVDHFVVSGSRTDTDVLLRRNSVDYITFNSIGNKSSKILYPSDDSTYTLGTSSNYWSNTYSDRITVNATAYADGATAGQFNIVATNLAINGSAGATGSFTTADSKTVTVTKGLITAIV